MANLALQDLTAKAYLALLNFELPISAIGFYVSFFALNLLGVKDTGIHIRSKLSTLGSKFEPSEYCQTSQGSK